MPQLRPCAFISERVEVEFAVPPVLSKKPGPPDAFVWRGADYPIAQVLSRWFDFGRRGDMGKNMQPAHAAIAAQRGSWGVGRFYFRVRVDGGRVFDLYYDRAPESAGDRQGHWVLWRELAEVLERDDPSADRIDDTPDRGTG